jgi:ribulose-phosphate 3-epimerase
MIAPCVTAENAAEFRAQMAKVAPFASRLHIDISDGQFSPVKLVNPIQTYWPDNILADLHLMVRNPSEHIETLISLNPNLVIVQAEAQGDLLGMIRQLKSMRIKTGVALLQQTNPDQAKELISDCDHVLIFSGDLGHFGGSADLSLLKKVAQIKAINPNVEIGWDGGASKENVGQLTSGGVDVINVGGAIQNADDPAEVYKALINSEAALEKT